VKYEYLVVVGLSLLLAGCQNSRELKKTPETGTLQTSDQRGSLVLYKEPLIEFQGRRQSNCDGLYEVEAGNDVADLRDFSLYFCEGRYSLTLDGEKGSTLTLFGQFNYKQEAGFMVIVKNDNRKIWLINLEDIPSGKWVEVEANRDYGAYTAYYKTVSRFSQNISSVKWGQWWQGEIPQ
jgi:hypothetical protein